MLVLSHVMIYLIYLRAIIINYLMLLSFYCLHFIVIYIAIFWVVGRMLVSEKGLEKENGNGGTLPYP